MQDEMLAHRLGLVPLRVDPSRFSEKTGAARHLGHLTCSDLAFC